MEWKVKNNPSDEINHKRPITERPIIRHPTDLSMNAGYVSRRIKNIPLKWIMLQVNSNLKLGTIVSNTYHKDHGKM
jgi:hypothetical protein